MYSEFQYYSNNILFLFVFGHNSEPEYYSYSYSAKYLCTNIIRIHICSSWENEYHSYSYSVKILIPNIIRIRIRSKKQYSLTSVHFLFWWLFFQKWYYSMLRRLCVAPNLQIFLSFFANFWYLRVRGWVRGCKNFFTCHTSWLVR